MRSSLALKTSLAVAALASLAVLAPAAQAVSPTTSQCVPDHCDVLIEYYSDATYTIRVGEFEDGPCGQIDNGVHTDYLRVFRRVC